VGAIRTALIDTTTAVVVDVAEVGFIDSSGISALVDGRALAVAHGVGYRVVNASGIVARVFDIAGVAEFLRGQSS